VLAARCGLAAGVAAEVQQHAAGGVRQTVAAKEPIGGGHGGISARSAAAAMRAENAAQAAGTTVDMAGAFAGSAMGANEEAQAQMALQQTTMMRDEAKAMLPSIQHQAYALARHAAEAQVNKLKLESDEYFRTLMAEFEALAVPQKDPNAESIAKATEPYYNAESMLTGMVESYNLQATQTLAEARNLVGKARSLATTAQYEQATGLGYVAQQHMVEAHQTIVRANNKRGLAYRVRQLADNVNSAIPSYQQAAEMAATHAFATFTPPT